MLRSLKLNTLTRGTNRLVRYISQTHASLNTTSINGRGPSDITLTSTLLANKTAICFDSIFKHADNGLILLSELQFALGLEVFEIVCVQCGFESVECDDYWSSRFSRTLADLPVRSRK